MILYKVYHNTIAVNFTLQKVNWNLLTKYFFKTIVFI